MVRNRTTIGHFRFPLIPAWTKTILSSYIAWRFIFGKVIRQTAFAKENYIKIIPEPHDHRRLIARLPIWAQSWCIVLMLFLIRRKWVQAVRLMLELGVGPNTPVDFEMQRPGYPKTICISLTHAAMLFTRDYILVDLLLIYGGSPIVHFDGWSNMAYSAALLGKLDMLSLCYFNCRYALEWEMEIDDYGSATVEQFIRMKQALGFPVATKSLEVDQFIERMRMGGNDFYVSNRNWLSQRIRNRYQTSALRLAMKRERVYQSRLRKIQMND